MSENKAEQQDNQPEGAIIEDATAVEPESTEQVENNGADADISEELPDGTDATDDVAEAAITEDTQSAAGEQDETAKHLQQLSTLLHTNYEKTEQLANDVIALSGLTQETAVAVGELSLRTQKISDDIEQSADNLRASRLSNIISPVFLAISLVVLLILLISSFILASHHKRLQERLDKVSQMAISAVEQQNQKMAAFDANFEEQLGNQIKTVRDTVGKDSSRSKLNRLRQGNQERKLVRSSNGDWLLSGTKQELVTDQETIDALNAAFERSGRPLVPPKGMPPHSVATYLKADGRGGTELVVTKEAVAEAQPEKAEKPAVKKGK
ncbi:MAG: hypothetical protein RBQ99_10955 [Trichlorobacter sp.]|nr:hypothetical protein [Trichlorobacter sp.]